MSQTRVCPVCGRPGLPPNCASCPQCDADLTCFQALDSLASPAAATAAETSKRRFPWAAAAGLALIAMLLLAGLAASMKSRLSDLDRQLAELKAAEQKAAAANWQKQEPQPQLAAAENAAEQAKPKLPPESKIQIDARVRIIDEREAAQQAALAQTAGKQSAEKPKQLVAAVPKGPASPAAKLAEEQKPAAEAAQDAVVHQPAPPVKQIAAPPKVVSEAIRQPDEDKEEPVGAAMPPLPVAQMAEQQQSAAAQEKTAEEQKPASSSAPSDSPEESEKTELAADLPETPPVLLKPSYRKHRVPPAPHHASVENAPQTTPAARGSPAASQAAPQTSGGTFSYLVKDGETAWDIAGRFYGDRKYYPVVMEQNPHIFLGFIRKNSSVQLFADRREAAAMYQRKIEQRDGLLLWKYDVRPGETWRSIYARFFLPRYSGMIFYGDQDVAPGKTVRIILR